jgi:predicted permease
MGSAIGRHVRRVLAAATATLNAATATLNAATATLRGSRYKSSNEARAFPSKGVMGLKHVLRRLIRLPVFTGVAVATLALGIGANSAIFGVVEGVILKPLPFPRAELLVAVDHTAPGVNIANAGAAPFLYFTYREDARSFDDIGLWRRDTDTITGRGEPEEVRTLDVTDGILSALGVQPALGRIFSRRDDSPDSPETVLLANGYWRAKFGAEASVIGQRLLVNGRPREIIGVLPETFQFLDFKPALLLPMRLDRSKTFLGQFSYQSLARLKSGVTLAQANADIGRLIPVALHRFPAFPGYDLKLIEQARLGALVRPLKETLVGDVTTLLWVLMGTVGIVLLIACANVANLLLVRVDSRQHELAVRVALGAGRGQIARELLTESVILGLAGGVLGLGLAAAGLRLLATIAPANLPRLEQIGIDGTVLLFTVAISLLSGVLFGLVPVFKYVGPQLAGALRAEGRSFSQSRERHRARSALVIAQVALALVLLIGSMLMIRTFQALKQVAPGFARPDQLQTFRISIPQSSVPDPTEVVRMEQAIAEKIAGIAGVSSVGLSTVVPMDRSGWSDPVFAEDRPQDAHTVPSLRRFKFASPGLIATMGNSLVAGRDFTWTDVYEKRHVAMVSENLARELWSSPVAALGKRIRERNEGPWREIVGVVSDERDDGLSAKAPAIAFWPILMDNFSGDEPFVMRSLAYMVRTPRAGSRGLMAEVGQAVWSINPNLPLANVRTLQEVYDKSLARTTFTLVMLAIAGAMALLLGLTGVYGVMSYTVSHRMREIGIRLALGAQDRAVRRMFVGYAARLATVGIACGLIAAVGLSRWMTSFLYGVPPIDPLTYASTAFGLVATAALASYVPARRATAVDPVEALRAE